MAFVAKIDLRMNHTPVSLPISSRDRATNSEDHDFIRIIDSDIFRVFEMGSVLDLEDCGCGRSAGGRCRWGILGVCRENHCYWSGRRRRRFGDEGKSLKEIISDAWVVLSAGSPLKSNDEIAPGSLGVVASREAADAERVVRIM